MKLDEFRHRLDADGTDMTAWPEAQRVAGEHLVATEPAAQAALSEAQRLERLIARGMANRPSQDTAAARVLAMLPRPLPAQRRSLLSWAWPAALLDVDLAPSRLRIAALAMIAVLGIALGLLGPDLSDAGPAPVTETNLAAVFEPEPLTGVRP